MQYPCPCCGYLMFDEAPGSYEICKICFWEDDLSQLRFASTRGANHVSLIEAQKNYVAFGVCEKEYLANVRTPNDQDVKDKNWRPINEKEDNIEESVKGFDYGLTYATDPIEYYYWR